MSDAITIYGHPVSPFVRKALLAMAMKGIKPAKMIPLTPVVSRDELKGINPLKRIPVFVQGDLVLPDSTVICEYLDDAYEGEALYPTDPVLKARARWFEEYADTYLAEQFVFNCFFEKVVKPNVLKQEADQDKITRAETQTMPEILDYLETQFSDGGFLLGSTPYVPDFAIGFFLQNAKFAGWKVDEVKWPKTANFLNKLSEHSAFQETSKLGWDMLAARRAEMEPILNAFMKS